jgi:hypothetical protein
MLPSSSVSYRPVQVSPELGLDRSANAMNVKGDRLKTRPFSHRFQVCQTPSSTARNVVESPTNHTFQRPSHHTYSVSRSYSLLPHFPPTRIDLMSSRLLTMLERVPILISSLFGLPNNRTNSTLGRVLHTRMLMNLALMIAQLGIRHRTNIRVILALQRRMVGR